MPDLIIQDLAMTDQIAEVENAIPDNDGVENARFDKDGPSSRIGNCQTWQSRTKQQTSGGKMQKGKRSGHLLQRHLHESDSWPAALYNLGSGINSVLVQTVPSVNDSIWEKIFPNIVPLPHTSPSVLQGVYRFNWTNFQEISRIIQEGFLKQSRTCLHCFGPICNVPNLLLLVCVSFTTIGQPWNSVLIRRV